MAGESPPPLPQLLLRLHLVWALRAQAAARAAALLPRAALAPPGCRPRAQGPRHGLGAALVLPVRPARLVLLAPCVQQQLVHQRVLLLVPLLPVLLLALWRAAWLAQPARLALVLPMLLQPKARLQRQQASVQEPGQSPAQVEGGLRPHHRAARVVPPPLRLPLGQLPFPGLRTLRQRQWRCLLSQRAATHAAGSATAAAACAAAVPPAPGWPTPC